MDKKVKHLEMIQDIITRMENNLFLLKGRTVTLIVGIFAIISDKVGIIYVLFSFGILMIFWILDGFFLSIERCFRGLYDEVRKKREEEIDFSMNIKPYMKGKNTWIKSIFSKTLLIFYGMLFVIISTIFISKLNIKISIGLNSQNGSGTCSESGIVNKL